MLTFLQLVKQHISHGNLDIDNIKAIYIAPMKALAQEVVAKFGERLSPLGLVVKEYTGDMQLTKQEISDSQLLVTTPEKYDVITRKGTVIFFNTSELLSISVIFIVLFPPFRFAIKIEHA